MGQPAAICKIWEVKPQHLANVAWAFAALYVKNSALLEAVISAAV